MWGSVDYYALIAIGLVLLIVGGEAVVRGAVTLADRMSLSPLFVGLVIVAFGTSAPEMAVSIGAVMHGETDIAVGNVVGSNISNILLILGLGAVIFPIPAQRNVVFRDALVLLLAAAFLTWLGRLGGDVERQMGICMLTLLGAYLAFSYFSERVRLSPAGEVALDVVNRKRIHIPGLVLDLIIIGVGVVAISFGANYLVDGSVVLARKIGVSEAVIGLSVVAVGTSLPELTTVIIAAIKKHPELAVGNIIGSNIFNIFAVLGTTATVMPVTISSTIAHFDLPIMFLSTLILVPFLMTNWRLSRIEGLLLLIGYGAYIWLLFSRENGHVIEIF
ncbi:MAG: calcium/sodium antiporter [Alphaproteobacteria bacterium]|nr:MAG: calcium/sodium antiporter [Alphaproteobacteria bacterium]